MISIHQRKSNQIDFIMSVETTTILAPHIDTFMAKAQELGLEGSAIEELRKCALEKIPSELKTSKKTKKIKNNEPPCDAERCQARRWNDGLGDRCCGHVHENGLCKNCFKKEQVCATPMTSKTIDTANGTLKYKKVGLFWGRYLDSQGEKLPLPMLTPDGSALAVIWRKNPEGVAEAEKHMANGKTFLGLAPYLHQVPAKWGGRPKIGTGEPKKRKPKKEKNTNKPPRVKNAYMFYLEENRDELKEQLSSGKHVDIFKPPTEEADNGGQFTVPVSSIAKLAGQKWKAMSEEERAPYVEKNQAAKLEAAHAWDAKMEAESQNNNEETHEEEQADSIPEGEVDQVAEEIKQNATNDPLLKTMVNGVEGLDPSLSVEPASSSTENTITVENIEKLKLPALKKMATSVGISFNGLKKPELKAALHKYLQEKETEEGEVEEDDEEVENGNNDDEDEEEDDEDEDEAAEHTLSDGTVVYKTSNGQCYNEDGEELGVWDSKTNMVIETTC